MIIIGAAQKSKKLSTEQTKSLVSRKNMAEFGVEAMIKKYKKSSGSNKQMYKNIITELITMREVIVFRLHESELKSELKDTKIEEKKEIKDKINKYLLCFFEKIEKENIEEKTKKTIIERTEKYKNKDKII